MALKVYKRQVDRKPTDNKHTRFSDKQKLAIVSTWVLTGSPSITAQTHNCTVKSIEYWKKQKWWKDAVTEIKASRNHEMSGKLSKIFDKSLKQLEDRVENGEYIFDQKTGAIRRVPVNSRNLNTIARDALDRQLLLDKVTSEERVEAIDITARLTQLMDEFKKIASGKTSKQGEIIDVQEITTVVEESNQQEAPNGRELEFDPEPSSDPANASGASEASGSYPGTSEPRTDA